MNRINNEIAEAAAEYYHLMLNNPQGNAGMEYLKNRNINEESIERFNLGYATDKKDGLVKYLFEKGHSKEEIMESGLACLDESRNVIDKFVNRIMIPIMNSQWRIEGFGGRTVVDEEPKYINSLDCVRFHFIDNVFGFNQAKETKAKYMIICDGFMDVISLHQAGFDMAVASFGMKSTFGLACNLKRYVDKVIIAYKNDESGRKAAFRVNEKLYDCDIKTYYLDLETYRDVDEYIKNAGKEAFEERLDCIRPIGKVKGYQDFCRKIGKADNDNQTTSNTDNYHLKSKQNTGSVKKNEDTPNLVKAVKEMLDRNSMSYDVRVDLDELDMTTIYYGRSTQTGVIGKMRGEIIIDEEYNTCVSVVYPNIRVDPKTRRELENLLFNINCLMVFGMWQIAPDGEIRYIRSTVFPGKKIPMQMLCACLINDVFDVVKQHEAAILTVSLEGLDEIRGLRGIYANRPEHERYEQRFQEALGLYY